MIVENVYYNNNYIIYILYNIIMAQRLAGETTNSKFDTQRPEKEVTTTTIGTKNRLDTTSILYDSNSNPINPISVSTDLKGVGNITIGLTEVEIEITGDTKSIRIRADTTNTGIIFIGKTGVLSDGSNDFARLESGDEMIIDYDDTTNALYAISDTATQKINVGALIL